MRVLAVGELAVLREHRLERLGERLGRGEPAGDCSLVRGRHLEGLGRQPPPRVDRELALGLQLSEHLLVALRSRDRRNVREVLRRRAQHRRAADVDHLDRFLLLRAVPRRHLEEGVEVHADEVERLDVVLLERGEVVVAVAPGEDRRVDARVQRLHAPAEQLRHLGHVLHRGHRDPELLQERCRAAARHDLDAELLEPAREVVQALFVIDREERSLDHEPTSSRTTFGKRRCSAACTRSRKLCSSSSGMTGTRSAAITGPVSIPPST